MGAAVVDLSWNAFQRLTPLIFVESSVISKLTMKTNRLRTVDCLTSMTRIKTLILSKNRITTLPNGTFNESMPLIEVDLSHNRLSSIEHLKVLTNLRVLSLQYNRIQNIPSRVLQKLENLEILNIQHNIISVIEGKPDNMVLLSLVCREKKITSFDFFQPVAKHVTYTISLCGNPLQQINISHINAVYLDLSNCSIHTIHALNKMEHVRYIFLYNNLIKHIPANTMFDLPNVYYIDLMYNFIEQCPKIHLPSLRSLSLDHNKIRNITEECLNAFPNLRILAVGHNHLGNLPELSHENLEELELQGNGINYISSNTAKYFPKLIFLSLAGNRIVSLGDIRGALSVPQLYLANNLIDKVSRNELFYRSNSVELQLSNNFISVVNFSTPGNIISIVLDKNCIEEVLLGALNSQTQNLILSYNSISSLSFLISFPNLVTLDLSGNRITYIARADFTASRALESIKLSSNYIRTIESDSLTRLTNLRYVDLANNSLSVLGDSTFPHASLRYLRIASNSLLNASNIFTGIPNKLQSLDLSDNAFTHSINTILNVSSMSKDFLILKMSTFSRNIEAISSSLVNIEFTHLHYLILSAVNLSRVSLPLSAPSLTRLFLKFTELQRIPRDVLRSTPDVEDLFLEGNCIRYIRKKDFINIRKLYQINLASNQIHYIERGAFQLTEKLRNLDLSNNNIKQLWYEAHFSQLFQEKGLVLDGNPWDCTCVLRWLQNELIFTGTEIGLRCASPSFMSNKSIVLEDLLCSPAVCEGMPTYQVVRVLAGGVASILCPVVLDNADRVEWSIKTNSSLSNMSAPSPEAYLGNDEKTGESTWLIYSANRYYHADIQCSAINWAGTTTIDIRLEVCESLSDYTCQENGSLTADQWNTQVNKSCHPSTNPYTLPPSTSSPNLPTVARSHVETMIYSKLSILVIATMTAFIGGVDLLILTLELMRNITSCIMPCWPNKCCSTL